MLIVKGNRLCIFRHQPSLPFHQVKATTNFDYEGGRYTCKVFFSPFDSYTQFSYHETK